MDRELSTATSGIRGMMRIDHGIRLQASAGMEYDVQTSQGAMTGTSGITDFENLSPSSPTRKANRTRGAGPIGAPFPITPNAAFVVNTSLRQQAYTSNLSLGVMASVMVGFCTRPGCSRGIARPLIWAGKHPRFPDFLRRNICRLSNCGLACNIPKINYT